MTPTPQVIQQVEMNFDPEIHARSFADTRSHRDDPQTSRDAAQHAVSNKAQEERIAIRQALAARGPMTPRQIAAATGIDYYEVQRRMSETAGIERTGERDDRQCIWRAA